MPVYSTYTATVSAIAAAFYNTGMLAFQRAKQTNEGKMTFVTKLAAGRCGLPRQCAHCLAMTDLGRSDKENAVVVRSVPAA